MRSSIPRTLSLLGICTGFAIAGAAPAQAYTPPIGTDKGSVVGRDASNVSSPAAQPAPDGIIAILIG
jgi:hypothetical protein